MELEKAKNKLDLVFDRVRYQRDLREEKVMSTYAYLITTIDDGLYYWEDIPLKFSSVKDVVYTGIIRVKSNYIHWEVKLDSKSKDLLSSFFFKLYQEGEASGDKLKAIIIKFEEEFIFITDYLTRSRRVLKYGLNYEINSLIGFLSKREPNLLNNLYLLLLNYFIEDLRKCKEHFDYCYRYIEDYNLDEFKVYIDEIYKIIIDNNHEKQQISNISIVIETEDSFKNKPDEELYACGLAQTISEIVGYKIDIIRGNRNEILDKIRTKQPQYLILAGHGSIENGYLVNEGLHPLPNPNEDYINNEHLKNILKNYSKTEFVLMDFVCSKGHFVKHKHYPFPLTVFSNRKYENGGTFNYPGAYYYSMGFFMQFMRGPDFVCSHKIARLTLSMFGYDYIDTYDFEKI